MDLAEVQAIIPRSETRVEGGFLNEIGEEIKRITNLVGPEFRRATQAGDVAAKRNLRVVRDLKNLGSLIFSHLLPQAARDRLRSSESSNLYLRLDDQLIHIPWELAFDGQQFLGMKFRVGRQIITHHKVVQPALARAVSDTLKVLIVSDPSETLKNVTKECEQLCEILDGIPTLDVRLIGGRGVKRIPLLAALRESDIVHFAGHSQFDEKNPENSGWLLYDGLLAASEISKLDQTPLLVFSNSCQAGATQNWQGEYRFEGQAFGLGSAFLLAGVRNFVGTFCVVHDEESRFLAVEFYRRMAQGETIGQALLEARVATAEGMGLDRLTWASYMLYGDPDYKLALTSKDRMKPHVTFPESQYPIIQPAAPVNHTSVMPEMRSTRLPRIQMGILVFVSLGLLALIIFSLFLDQSSRNRESTDSLAPSADLKQIPSATERYALPDRPIREDIKQPSSELNLSPSDIDEDINNVLINAASAERALFLRSQRYTARVVNLIEVGFRPNPSVELKIDYADNVRFQLSARKPERPQEFWVYDSQTGKITPEN